MMVEEDQTASACDIMDVVEGIITGLGAWIWFTICSQVMS